MCKVTGTIFTFFLQKIKMNDHEKYDIYKVPN